MNREDYMSDETANIENLRRLNTKLSRIVEGFQEENGDLNIEILKLRARIKELEAKYEGGQP